MDYRSRWEEVPLDVLYQQILILDNSLDILTFCYDPYIESKICQDKNGLIWKLLYKRDLSESFVLGPTENLMDRYLQITQKCKTLEIEDLLWFASENGYENLIRKIPFSDLPLITLSQVLNFAAHYGQLEIVKCLIEKGVDFHFHDEKVLRCAAEWRQFEIVKYLIEKGANLRAYDDATLIWAAENGQLEMVEYLIERGADIHADGEQSLKMASINGHWEMVKYLIEKGADLHSWDVKPLKWAAKSGHLETVKYLIEKGANIHANNEEALIWAAHYGYVETVKYLIEKGANVQIALNHSTERGISFLTNIN